VEAMKNLLNAIGLGVIRVVSEMGRMMLLFIESIVWFFRPPYRPFLIVKQMEFVGVKSTLVVIITGLFTGGVLALQTYYGFKMFSAESLVGATVGLSMTRELGPVLTSLMVTGRAGSAMAAEIGTMRVTEQIDALSVLAVNPIEYLIVPRMIAGVVMLPILTAISDFLGILGGYFVGVELLGISSGAFINKLIQYVDLSDLYNGLIKAACFGLILSFVGCYKGYYTSGGAEGVGRATTQAVVMASAMILIADYFLTALMF
jgi:phospholipid/cholesterol/gamma-HCH transport system permease protein